jgi:tRNA G26 N,N-dimethylase Trm1
VNGANNCKYTNHIMNQLQKEGFRVVFKHYKNFKLKPNQKSETEPQPVADL